MKKIWIIFFLLAAVCGSGYGQDLRPGMISAGLYDLEAGTVRLNSSYKMPVVGINCPQLSVEKTESLVYAALQKGFRYIQVSAGTAAAEGAGRGIGIAIEDGIVSRDELFLAAVFSPADYENMKILVENTLTRLGVDYLDLMVMQQSVYDRDAKAWQSLERALEEGMVHSLGLNGFTDIRNFDLFLDTAVTVQPSVLQIPVYPYEQRSDMKEHLAEHGTVLVSDFPLGGHGEEQILFADPVISVAATWHQKTSAQIILRWQLQSENVVVLTPEDEAQISEYADLFDFALSSDEMEQISALDRQQTLISFESEEVAPVEEWF